MHLNLNHTCNASHNSSWLDKNYLFLKQLIPFYKALESIVKVFINTIINIAKHLICFANNLCHHLNTTGIIFFSDDFSLIHKHECRYRLWFHPLFESRFYGDEKKLYISRVVQNISTLDYYLPFLSQSA